MALESAELPPAFWQAVAEFNSGEFYACHDTLEALWMEASEPERTFYQGILQMAVAFYHYGNGNLRGTMILLGEGMKRLRDYPALAYGIDLASLLTQGKDCLAQAQTQFLQTDTNITDTKPAQLAPLAALKIQRLST